MLMNSANLSGHNDNTHSWVVEAGHAVGAAAADVEYEACREVQIQYHEDCCRYESHCMIPDVGEKEQTKLIRH